MPQSSDGGVPTGTAERTDRHTGVHHSFRVPDRTSPFDPGPERVGNCWQNRGMNGLDLVLVLRYRKAVTYGFHVLLGALEEHVTSTSYEVVFAESTEATIAATGAGLERAGRVLVLWSFYSPDAEALAAELAAIKAAAPGALHVAGGVHATAEPVQTLDAGWDVAAVGEGETTLLALVDAKGDPAGIPGLTYRDAARALVRTGKPRQRPLDDFRAFSLRWHRFNALEITRGCVFACAY